MSDSVVRGRRDFPGHGGREVRQRGVRTGAVGGRFSLSNRIGWRPLATLCAERLVPIRHYAGNALQQHDGGCVLVTGIPLVRDVDAPADFDDLLPTGHEEGRLAPGVGPDAKSLWWSALRLHAWSPRPRPCRHGRPVPRCFGGVAERSRRSADSRYRSHHSAKPSCRRTTGLIARRPSRCCSRAFPGARSRRCRAGPGCGSARRGAASELVLVAEPGKGHPRVAVLVAATASDLRRAVRLHDQGSGPDRPCVGGRRRRTGSGGRRGRGGVSPASRRSDDGHNSGDARSGPPRGGSRTATPTARGRSATAGPDAELEPSNRETCPC